MAVPLIIAAAGLLMIIGFAQQGSCGCPKCENAPGSPANVARFAADAGPMIMDAAKAAEILAGNGDQVIMFFKPGCPPCEQTKPNFVAASASGQAKAPMLLADVTEPFMSGLNQKMQITGVPHICRIRGGKQVDELRERSPEAIIAFANKGGESAVGLPPRVARFAADAGPVIVDAAKAAKILAGNGDQIVMFFKPGCPPCEQTKPNFVAASASGQAKTPMMLADVTVPHMAGLNQKMQITGVPHICRIRGGEQVDVLRERSPEAIVAFANK